MPKRGPLFLKRQSYRRRRLRDLSRLLPLIGGVLFLIPVLWAPGTTARPDTAPDGVFLFAVWIGLIVVAAALAPAVGTSSDADEAEDDR
ncbi:MAG: hypothetical protein RIR62_556 [Pseudomonadota bacterium]|jgi:hypothetical protein